MLRSEDFTITFSTQNNKFFEMFNTTKYFNTWQFITRSRRVRCGKKSTFAPTRSSTIELRWQTEMWNIQKIFLLWFFEIFASFQFHELIAQNRAIFARNIVATARTHVVMMSENIQRLPSVIISTLPSTLITWNGKKKSTTFSSFTIFLLAFGRVLFGH